MSISRNHGPAAPAHTGQMVYTGEPLANLLTLGPLATVKMLREQLREDRPGTAGRIRRRDGQPVDLAQIDALLAELGEHLGRAQDVINDYEVAPRFTIGQHVNVVSDDGRTILERGFVVRDVRQHGTVDVIDADGNHDTFSEHVLRAAD